MSPASQAEPSGPPPEIPPLITIGNPRLAQPSREVPEARIATPEFQGRLETLRQAMTAYQGIGIAAPQIGWFERFFIMGLWRSEPGVEPELELRAWINPRIVAASPEQVWAWEGCLSVPGLRGWIRRPAAVAVQGFDAQGRPIGGEFTGWAARVFQHEFDHLEGLLFPYRAEDARHLVSLEELARRETWPDGWPAPGARDTPPGDVLADLT